MYRSRRKRLPPLPKTRAEINLTGLERFLLQNEGSSDRILIFSTGAMLHLLCDLEAMYVVKGLSHCVVSFDY